MQLMIFCKHYKHRRELPQLDFAAITGFRGGLQIHDFYEIFLQKFLPY